MWERYRNELHELEMGGERREDLVELLAAELEGNAEGRAANAEAMQRRRRKGAPLKAALLLAA
ncbi:MAG: hypothetical protein PUD96_07465, partial [Coriobacteriaceae bacterium]|nr:hypothetical protein [Coriobacteriaceae bacterium]